MASVATDAGYCHVFPAVQGTQAGRVFYVATCPLRVIPKIFIFDEEEVPPELRAQRTVNRARVPEIASYLTENKESYVVSALTASIDGRVEFEPFRDGGPQSHLGTLRIPMDAQILINDGQHRRAAIEEAIRVEPSLGYDNVAVVFFIDEGLQRSQQMFADLNKHAIRPDDSLSTLYDHRDSCSELARYVAMTVEAFKGMTHMERSSLSNRSTKLFTLSGIKNASRALLKKGKKASISDAEKKLASAYWHEISVNIPDWQQAKQRKVAPADLRQNFVHAHGVALYALGVVGAELLRYDVAVWKKTLKKLRTLDWSRSNVALWEGRAMVMGRISKARNNVWLTANAIRLHLGMDLGPEEQQLEMEFAER